MNQIININFDQLVVLDPRYVDYFDLIKFISFSRNICLFQLPDGNLQQFSWKVFLSKA